MEATQPGGEILRTGELEIRPADGLVTVAGTVIRLSVREFALLVALARRRGLIVSRDELYRLVWGGQLRAGDRSVDVYVRKLRVKLEGALEGWRFIHTHVGFGYRFDAEPAERTRRSHDVHTAATAS